MYFLGARHNNSFKADAFGATLTQKLGTPKTKSGDNMKFSRDELIHHISRSESAKLVYRAAMNTGFWPDFPDYQIENFGRSLEAAKISEIKEIDNLIINNEKIIREYIAKIHSQRKNYWRLSPGFLCELVLILKYPSTFTKEYLTGNGWDEEIAEIVVSAATHHSESSA